jgi:hypothetical protein
VGLLEPTGQFRVVETQQGQVQFTAQVDAAQVAAHVKPSTEPRMLADGQRYFLLLNRSSEAENRRGYFSSYGSNSLRTETLTGPLYCFDKGTTRRLWYLDTLVTNQALFTERFAEQSALVFGTVTASQPNQPSMFRIMVIDKHNGRLRLNREEIYNGTFYALSIEPQLGRMRVTRSDLHLDISPDETQSQR